MKTWIIFSIGVSRHFCIHSYGPHGSRRVDLGSIDEIETILGVRRYDSVTFVTRYESDEEFANHRQPDAVVDQLREKYRRPGAHEE